MTKHTITLTLEAPEDIPSDVICRVAAEPFERCTAAYRLAWNEDVDVRLLGDVEANGEAEYSPITRAYSPIARAMGEKKIENLEMKMLEDRVRRLEHRLHELCPEDQFERLWNTVYTVSRLREVLSQEFLA